MVVARSSAPVRNRYHEEGLTMPTGYTAQLMEEGQDFRSFVLTCARAMGACIMQRDDPMSDLPRKQEPHSYNVESLRKAVAELSRLRSMNRDAQYNFASARKVEAVNSAAASLQRGKDENKRLDDAMAQVVAWTPPTPGHAGLKAFMVEQITISRNSLDYREKGLREVTDKPVQRFFEEAIESAEHDIEYHRKEVAKEQDRTNGRNEWIEQLYASLPSAPADDRAKE